MSATEEHAGERESGHGSRRDAAEDETAVRESWLKRLKHGFGSRLRGALAAVIGKLQALKGRVGDGEEESEERPRAKPAPPPPPPKEVAAPAAAEAGPKKSHKLRSALIVLALILLSAGLGAGAAYSLLSRLLKDQSLAIEGHDQEIRAFQLEEQEHGKKLAEALRQLEAEQKLRSDMEARLVEAEQKRLAAEALARAATVTVVPAAARAEQPTHVDSGAEAKLTLRPSKASSFRPPTTANCSLAGSDPATLRRCIEEYNKK